jgi:hypothetical protein
MGRILFVTVPRLVVGAIFLLGAVDGFYFIFTGSHLMHPAISERGLHFAEALEATGFFWPLMKTVELAGALCLLTNRAPALGLALLSPIMAVVVLFHLFLNPQGLPIAILLVICGLALLRAYAPRYESLLGADTGEQASRQR